MRDWRRLGNRGNGRAFWVTERREIIGIVGSGLGLVARCLGASDGLSVYNICVSHFRCYDSTLPTHVV